MTKTLIIARMRPEDGHEVAAVFGGSDATELPYRLGVRSRHLFRFHGLYAHLIDAADGIDERLARARDSALYADVNEQLKPFVSAYDPLTWRGPRDAMATEFYSWNASDHRLPGVSR